MYQAIQDPTIDEAPEIKDPYGKSTCVPDMYYFLHKGKDRYDTLFVSYLLTVIVEDVSQALKGNGKLFCHMELKIGESTFISETDSPIYMLNTRRRQALQFASDDNTFNFYPSGNVPVNSLVTPIIPYPEYWESGVESMFSFRIRENLCVMRNGQWVEHYY